MILGFAITPMLLVAGGLTVFATLVFQALVGLRVIHFKGRTHQRVHRIVGLTLLGLAAVHGTIAALWAFGV